MKRTLPQRRYAAFARLMAANAACRACIGRMPVFNGTPEYARLWRAARRAEDAWLKLANTPGAYDDTGDDDA